MQKFFIFLGFKMENTEKQFYENLWNTEEKKQEDLNQQKFEEEEKDFNLFKKRLQEDNEIIENTENPFNHTNSTIIREISRNTKDIK